LVNGYYDDDNTVSIHNNSNIDSSDLRSLSTNVFAPELYFLHIKYERNMFIYLTASSKMCE